MHILTPTEPLKPTLSHYHPIILIHYASLLHPVSWPRHSVNSHHRPLPLLACSFLHLHGAHGKFQYKQRWVVALQLLTHSEPGKHRKEKKKKKSHARSKVIWPTTTLCCKSHFMHVHENGPSLFSRHLIETMWEYYNLLDHWPPLARVFQWWCDLMREFCHDRDIG